LRELGHQSASLLGAACGWESFCTESTLATRNPSTFMARRPDTRLLASVALGSTSKVKSLATDQPGGTGPARDLTPPVDEPTPTRETFLSGAPAGPSQRMRLGAGDGYSAGARALRPPACSSTAPASTSMRRSEGNVRFRSR
jgi:hypothetical protein